MSDNVAFTTALSKVKSIYQYINMINKFGRHFIVNQDQCGTVLRKAKVAEDEIEKVKVIITKFWSKSSTSEFFKKQNWENFLQIEGSLVLAIDHPILYSNNEENA